MTIEYVAPVTTLLSAAAATGAGDFCTPGALKRTFQATQTSNGTSCDVNIEGSNDGVGWVIIASISIVVSEGASGGVVTDSPWRHVRANVTAITGGSVTVTMGSTRGL